MLKKVLLLSICLTNPAIAKITESAVPGGIKKIKLSGTSKPQATYKDKKVAIIKDGDHYIAIIGIPLESKIKQQILKQTKPQKLNYKFKIQAKKYRVQKLTIKNKRKVTPLGQDQKRIEQEQLDFDKTLASWSEQNDSFKENFIAPVRGYITSTYGLKRIYNNIPKSPHTALDIAASLGTPIKAPASGKIINIHSRFYTGNTIIIDHGQGLMSLYAHLNEFKVKNGQEVKQGDIIGTVGKTGRVTGPHLHWALYINQTSVNPLLFIARKDILPLAKKKQGKK